MGVWYSNVSPSLHFFLLGCLLFGHHSPASTSVCPAGLVLVTYFSFVFGLSNSVSIALLTWIPEFSSRRYNSCGTTRVIYCSSVSFFFQLRISGRNFVMAPDQPVFILCFLMALLISSCLLPKDQPIKPNPTENLEPAHVFPKADSTLPTYQPNCIPNLGHISYFSNIPMPNISPRKLRFLISISTAISPKTPNAKPLTPASFTDPI